jgi:apolipoprotein N-acyltransferase
VTVGLRDGRTLRVAPLICYDVLDPELARAAARDGAEIIVTLSNDSWFAFGVASAGVDVAATLVATVVPAHAVDTVVMRLGEWINPCSLVLTVAMLCAGRFLRRGPGRAA